MMQCDQFECMINKHSKWNTFWATNHSLSSLLPLLSQTLNKYITSVNLKMPSGENIYVAAIVNNYFQSQYWHEVGGFITLFFLQGFQYAHGQ